MQTGGRASQASRSWMRVFERSVILKRLMLPKWAGLKPTRWGEALVTRAQYECALWPFGLCFEMPLCRVLISYLFSHVLAQGYRRRCGACQCGSKTLNLLPFKSFLWWPIKSFDTGFKITNYYNCNSETTQPYVILITNPPPNKLYTYLN